VVEYLESNGLVSRAFGQREEGLGGRVQFGLATRALSE
jgi:hypothetical protein